MLLCSGGFKGEFSIAHPLPSSAFFFYTIPVHLYKLLFDYFVTIVIIYLLNFKSPTPFPIQNRHWCHDRSSKYRTREWPLVQSNSSFFQSSMCRNETRNKFIIYLFDSNSYIPSTLNFKWVICFEFGYQILHWEFGRK